MENGKRKTENAERDFGRGQFSLTAAKNCSACGAEARRGDAQFCLICGKLLREDYQPLDSLRASYRLQGQSFLIENAKAQRSNGSVQTKRKYGFTNGLGVFCLFAGAVSRDFICAVNLCHQQFRLFYLSATSATRRAQIRSCQFLSEFHRFGSSNIFVVAALHCSRTRQTNLVERLKVKE